MARKGQKNSTMYPHSWFKALDKLPDDVAGRIYKAVQRLDITGEMTKFEEGSIEDILFSQYAFQTDGFKESYEEECRNRSEAAKKREAQKAQQSTTKNLVAQAVPDRSGVDRIGKDRIGKDRKRKDVSGGEVSGVDASAPSADTAPPTTTVDENSIRIEWNNQEYTRSITSVTKPTLREERTEMAIAVAGGIDAFLELIRSIEHQAYFRNRYSQGYRVDYDWFITPDNFQGILEGKYKDIRKSNEGWEVIDFGT